MLQSVVYGLLTDDVAVRQVGHARDEYAARQQAFSAAMAGHGMPSAASDGLNVWLPVADERAATVNLAAAGIRVARGGPFQLGAGAAHVRVTVGVIRTDVASIAAVLAAAARA